MQDFHILLCKLTSHWNIFILLHKELSCSGMKITPLSWGVHAKEFNNPTFSSTGSESTVLKHVKTLSESSNRSGKALTPKNNRAIWCFQCQTCFMTFLNFNPVWRYVEKISPCHTSTILRHINDLKSARTSAVIP